MPKAESDISVIRRPELFPGAATPGITRSKAFETRRAVVAQSRIEPGSISDWHHHSLRVLFGYLVSGGLRFDYGARGDRSASVSAGEFFQIPAGLIHRDVNPGRAEDAVVVAVLVGRGPEVVNVPGPG